MNIYRLFIDSINEKIIILIKMQKLTEHSGLFIDKLDVSNLMQQCKTLEMELKPQIRLFGKICHQKRDVSFFSNSVTGYHYSGVTAKAKLMPEWLQTLTNDINTKYNCQFNGALVNYYETGKQFISAHSDDDRQCIQREYNGLYGSVISSLSIGGARKFRISNKQDYFDVVLENGTYISMIGKFQKEFKHEILQETNASERYSITFREHISI